MIYRTKMIGLPAIAFLLMASVSMPAHAFRAMESTGPIAQVSTPVANESGSPCGDEEDDAASAAATSSLVNQVGADLASNPPNAGNMMAMAAGGSTANPWTCTGAMTADPTIPAAPIPSTYSGEATCHITCTTAAGGSYTVEPDETWKIGGSNGKPECATGACNAAKIAIQKLLGKPLPPPSPPKPTPAPKPIVNESGPTVTESLTPPVVYESR